MTVLCDDSGWGDLLLGVVIGCYLDRTGQFTYRLISVEYFKEPAFDQKLYLKEASRAVEEMLNDLNAAGEPVIFCTGYILSQAVQDMRRLGFKVSTGKITGPLQELVEQAYLNELRKIGYEPLPNREADSRMRARSFYHMLNWIKANPERWKYAKTGWSYFHPEKRELKKSWRWGNW